MNGPPGSKTYFGRLAVGVAISRDVGNNPAGVSDSRSDSLGSDKDGMTLKSDIPERFMRDETRRVVSLWNDPASKTARRIRLRHGDWTQVLGELIVFPLGCQDSRAENQTLGDSKTAVAERRWSPIVWRSRSARRNYLFGFCDFVVLDIDKGLPMQVAADRLCAYQYLIVATKNHRKTIDASGEVQDRYRIIIPTASRVNDLATFKATMRAAIAIFPEADRRCLDAARFYFTSPGPVLSRQTSGELWGVAPPSTDDKRWADDIIFGYSSKTSELNLVDEPIRDIKIFQLGCRKFSFRNRSRSARQLSDNHDGWTNGLTTGSPLTTSPSGVPKWEWLPAAKPIYYLSFKETPEAPNGGQSRPSSVIDGKRYLGLGPSSAGVLPIALTDLYCEADWQWLGDVLPFAVAGRTRLWVRYSTSSVLSAIGFAARQSVSLSAADMLLYREAMLEQIIKRGLIDRIDTSDSLVWNRPVPAIPTELQALRRWVTSPKINAAMDTVDTVVIQDIVKDREVKAAPDSSTDSNQTQEHQSKTHVPFAAAADAFDAEGRKEALPFEEILANWRRLSHGLSYELLKTVCVLITTRRPSRMDPYYLAHVVDHPGILLALLRLRRQRSFGRTHSPTTEGERQDPLARFSAKRAAAQIARRKPGFGHKGKKDKPSLVRYEKGYRRLLTDLVDGEALIMRDQSFIKGVKGRSYTPSKKFLAALVSLKRVEAFLDEAIRSTTSAAGDKLMAGAADFSKELEQPPKDGEWNDYIFRRVRHFESLDDALLFYETKFGTFLSAKRERKLQLIAAWNRFAAWSNFGAKQYPNDLRG